MWFVCFPFADQNMSKWIIFLWADLLRYHSFQPGFVQGIPAVRLNSSFLAFSTGIHSFGQSQPWQNENVNSLPG